MPRSQRIFKKRKGPCRRKNLELATLCTSHFVNPWPCDNIYNMEVNGPLRHILSEKGQDLVLVNGYKFRKDRETQRGVAWRCTVKTCRSRLYLNEAATLILFSNDVNHNHEDTGDTRQNVDFQQQPEQQQQQPFADVTHIEADPVEAVDFGGFAQDVGATYMSSANDQQQYCLKWKFHQNNQQAMFSKLLQKESFCDVTIACEEKILRAHKLMLSACSSYFEMILSRYEDQNPIIILKDVRYDDMSALLQFMYNGEVNIEQNQLSSLLETADMLKVKGLSDICGEARHLEDPLQVLDLKSEEQDANPTFEPAKIVQQRRRTISVPEESFQKPLKIPRRNTNTEITQNVPASVSQSAPSGNPSSSAGSSVHIEGVIRLPEFLMGHGSYHDFWKKPWVVKALKAVSDREMTLRNCSDLLGVGYNILYSRYRQVHGYLKEGSVDLPGPSQDYTYRFLRTATVGDQEGKIILRRDQLSAAAAALSAVNHNERPADTSKRENAAEPIVSVKLEPSSSLSDQFESEMMEGNTDVDNVGQMC
ncbi:uncharacterized protein [Periplaneta americana]|uniref:uncharacterized protein isoform X2 n=1 Tax=Periplaneta americana TaxID=6978 RepID=UPI0037E89A20